MIANRLTGHQNKGKSEMTAVVIITFLVCCTIVVCTYMHYTANLAASATTTITNHYYAHSLVTEHAEAEDSEHGSGSASSGVGCPAESGKDSLGAGDCSASGDQES
jgi:hypothetical protein